MTNDEAIKVIMNEISCVELQDFCEHKCGDCSLAMDDEDILEAYDLAIDVLGDKADEYRNCKEVKSDIETDDITGESREIMVCPTCNSYLSAFYEYCPHCGQALDWTKFWTEVTE